MKFEFEQKIEDINDLSRYSLYSNKRIRIIGIFVLIIVLINILSSSFVGTLSMGAIVSWIVPFLIFGILWFGFFKFLMNRKFKDPDYKKMMLGERVITLLEDEIIVKTLISETSFKWSAISKLSKQRRVISYFLENVRR